VAAAYDKDDACGAVAAFDKFFSDAQAARAARGGDAEAAFADASGIRASILAAHGAPVCSAAPRFDQPPAAKLDASDAAQLDVEVTFGEALFTARRGNGEQFTDVTVPGVDSYGGTVGNPALPTWRRLIAVPAGATVSLNVAPPRVTRTLRLHLYPVQKQPVDAAPKSDTFAS